MLWTFSWKRKREFINGWAMLSIILYISITSVCKFPWWMVSSLYLQIKSWKFLSGHYLMLLKLFLVICLVNYKTVFTETSRQKNNNWIVIYSLAYTKSFFYFKQDILISLKVRTIWDCFLHMKVSLSLFSRLQIH